MWRISVRVKDDPDWQTIWLGAGLTDERDARLRFIEVCKRIDGLPSAEANEHAGDWIEARLQGPNGEVDEYPSRAVAPSSA